MVINGKEIKSQALESIKNCKPSPILTTTFIVLLSGVSSAFSNIGEQKQIFTFIAFGFVLSIISSFIGVGYQWYCLNVARNQSPEPLSIFEIFTDGKLIKVFKLWLLLYVKILLWTLLFIVPGFIKSYSYSQSFYVLYDNPDWTASQCIEESKRLMKGNKLELFAFQISFIGWAILSLIALMIFATVLRIFLPDFVATVISMLTLMPLYTYMYVSMANFYNRLYIDSYNQY